MSTNGNIAGSTESQEPPCTFIPLLEAQKRKRLKKTEPEDLREFTSTVPYTQSVEELWRGRRVKMSSVMKDLEARQGPQEGKHIVTTRKHVVTCLKIALSESVSLATPSLLLILRRLFQACC